MSAEQLCKRLRASIRMDAINGDSHERAVCAKQMKEAADEIERLQRERDALRAERDELLEVLRNALPVLEFEVERRGSNDLFYKTPAGPVLDAARAVIAKAEGRSDE